MVDGFGVGGFLVSSTRQALCFYLTIDSMNHTHNLMSYFYIFLWQYSVGTVCFESRKSLVFIQFCVRTEIVVKMDEFGMFEHFTVGDPQGPEGQIAR